MALHNHRTATLRGDSNRPTPSFSLQGLSQAQPDQERRHLDASKKAAQHIYFEHGIIGFGDHQEYILAPAPKTVLKPFHVLVHAHNPNIHFLLLNFQDAQEDLSPLMREKVAAQMGLNQETLEGYFLVTSSGAFPEGLTFSINKRAPLFIDPLHQKGGQYVQTRQDLPLVFVLSHLSSTIRNRLMK